MQFISQKGQRGNFLNMKRSSIIKSGKIREVVRFLRVPPRSDRELREGETLAPGRWNFLAFWSKGSVENCNARRLCALEMSSLTRLVVDGLRVLNTKKKRLRILPSATACKLSKAIQNRRKLDYLSASFILYAKNEYVSNWLSTQRINIFQATSKHWLFLKNNFLIIIVKCVV